MITPDPSVIALALLLDLALGDPRWLPHPVVLIGRLITKLEKFLRNTMHHEQFAGVLLLIITVGCTMITTWLLLRFSAYLHPLAGFLVAVLVSFTCLAASNCLNLLYLISSAEGTEDSRKRLMSARNRSR